MDVASLATGILSCCFCWVPFWGIVLGITGIATSRPDENGKRNGLAVGGLVCGIIGLVICGIITIATACVGITAFS